MSLLAWPVIVSPLQRAALAELAAGRSRRSLDERALNDLVAKGLVDVQVGDVFLTERGRLLAASLGLPDDSEDHDATTGVYS